MNKIAKLIWNILVSRSVAIFLLLTVTLLLAGGALLPNPALISEDYKNELLQKHPIIYKLGEQYNSQKLARGYFFGFIASFLVVSTSMCSIDRLVTRYRNRRRVIAEKILEIPEEKSRTLVLQDTDLEELKKQILKWLKLNRYKQWAVVDKGRIFLIGSKGDAGFWGSIFFHFILIASLVGVAIYYFGGYRADFVFTEGFPYKLEENRAVYILQRPLWGELPLPEAIVGLVKQESKYAEFDPEYPIEHSALFQIREINTGKIWKKTVKINNPLEIQGKKFLLMVGGFSPRIVITDKKGRKVFDSFVNLGGKEGMEDSIYLQEEFMDIGMHLYPDYVIKDGQSSTKSLYLRNPVLELSVLGGGKKYRRMIPLHDTATVGDYLIHFPEVRKWVKMELVDEPGVGFFFVLSFFGILGIVIRFMDPDEKIFFILSRVGEGVELRYLSVARHFQNLTNQRTGELLESLRT